MALTPMMKQYFEIKDDYKDCLLFYRLGDFYEMFFEDAEIASKELDLTLTGRNCGLEERAPMCGVPFHAADSYISRLIDKGYKVAVCEQTEDPSLATDLVRREVVKVVTPGTVTENALLLKGNNNFILSFVTGEVFCAAYADVTTGDFFVEEVGDMDGVVDLVSKTAPSEIVYCDDGKSDLAPIKTRFMSIMCTPYPPAAFASDQAEEMLKEHFDCTGIDKLGLKNNDEGVRAAGGLLSYLHKTQMNALDHIKRIEVLSSKQYMFLDHFTFKNLELTETIRDGSKKGSLLWLLDKTKTSMGGRLLKSYISRPLLKKKSISERLSAVDELNGNYYLRTELRDALSNVYDIERLLARISYRTLDARNASALRISLGALPRLKELLKGAKSTLLKTIYESIDELNPLYELLNDAVIDDPPLGIRDGGIIRPGFNDDVDKYRDAMKGGKKWISEMEEAERERTGIKSLKIGYNRVFGYYIEVRKASLNQVPYNYVRRQTLAACERFVTKELKELEETVLSAEDKCNKLEYELFCLVREKIADQIGVLQSNSRLIAQVDVLQSLAQAAYDNNYVRPKITTDGVISIRNGRHPVVEKAVGTEFVPNDTYLDDDKNKLLVITGPNMAGKSTFMRQAGLIVVMAHIGSFVPADAASISLCDRVFTRVGAYDDLFSGQSTFMVEMNELATILANATDKSLLILDEIGRGTSTVDGLSIAWATIEYILKKLKSKTLFATHYHELTDLEGTIDGLANYSVSIREVQNTVVFLHKIVRGGANKSFGIEVARLAGLPEEMLNRAGELLKLLENSQDMTLDRIDETQVDEDALKKRRNSDRILGRLRAIDPNTLTPIEAISILGELTDMVNGEA